MARQRVVSPASIVLLMAFGVYLIAGGVVALFQGKWPIFLPPQLDIMYFCVRIFGESAARYVAGLLLVLAGMGSCGLGLLQIGKLTDTSSGN